jgi:putative membrane protein
MTLREILPALDAALILTSAICLLLGFFFIKQRRITWHKRSMLTAAVFAALFLTVYVIRWVLFGAKPFEGEGLLRTVYFGVLVSHLILAIAIVPLVFITLRRAFRSDFSRHKRIARITLPLWLYVAASGWVVYWMLYHLGS